MLELAINLFNQSGVSRTKPGRKPISLYVHWPFCKSKCPYCDFNSHVAQNIDKNAWLAAYIKQLDHFSPFLSDKCIQTIYFGGGTPSLAPEGVIEGILKYLHECKQFNIAENAEITLEANPTSIEIGKFKALKKAGINRVSVGIQSLRAKHLKFLGRNHSESESLKALDAAQNCFENTSFDLIYCLPNQSLSEWMEDLEYASKILDKHISLYQLTIEKGTKFYQEYHKNKAFEMPTQEVAAEFYDETLNFLKNKGIIRYEVSNYAKPGFESQHNLVYWNYSQYLGIGPGAHSRIFCVNEGDAELSGAHMALVMHHNPQKWLGEVLEGGSGLQSSQKVERAQAFEEKIMMGLRTIYGVPFGLLNAKKTQDLVELGYLHKRDGIVTATNEGFKVLNEVLRILLAE